jgi:hypothetical protein
LTAAAKTSVFDQSQWLFVSSQIMRNAHREGRLAMLSAICDVDSGAQRSLDNRIDQGITPTGRSRRCLRRRQGAQVTEAAPVDRAPLAVVLSHRCSAGPHDDGACRPPFRMAVTSSVASGSDPCGTKAASAVA